jgi:gliding motility-associated-like protein
MLYAQQTHEWVAGYQGTANINGQNVVTDMNNNVYSVGQFFGTVDFDPGPGTLNLTSPGQNDLYVTKLDQNGDLVWAFRLGNAARNRANNVTMDQNGDVYVAGYFEGTVDFDPGPGLFEMTSQFVVTAFLLKIDEDGNFLWARQFGGPNGVSEGLGVRVDNNNDVVLGGYFTGDCNLDPLGLGAVYTSTAGRDGFIVKHNSAGDFIWARHLEGNNDNRINSIDIDQQGNIVCGGFFQGDLNFDNLTPSASIETADGGGQDMFVGKYTSTGSYLWSRSIGGTGNDIVNGIVVNRFGNIFATGQFQNTVDFDPSAGTSNQTSAGSLESYVWSLDEDGLYNWSERIGSTANDLGLGITKDPQGSVYVTGYFNGTANFDGTTTLASLGANTIYVAKYEDAGNLVWASRMGGAGSDFGFGIYASYNWDIVSTGYFSNTSDFDPDGGGDVLNSLGSNDGYVHKFSQTCTAPTVVSAAADISVCVTPGADVELSVTGTLNDAVDWYWYSGSCGGTFEGTGATLTVNPTTTTTYFVRAEGACGTLPLCETVLVDVDDVPPVITTVAATEDVESGACYYVSENLTLPTVTDNCVVDTIFNDADLLLFPGVHTITWTAIDEAGNTTQETQQVTIEDNENPSIDAPADITVSADVNCQATGVVLGTPLAVDNCSVESVVNDAPATYPLGQTIVTWTAADPSGNTATDQQIITVVDDTDPTISGFPTDIIVSNDAAQCGAIVSWTAPSVSDNCPGSVIVQTQGLVSGSLFPVGITTIEYTATDGSGNEVIDSFTITVTDDENPTINAPADVTVSANSFCTAIGVALGSPAPADNCAVQSVTNDAPPIFTLGTTVVTWTVTDNAGNQSTDTQIVTVEDNDNPTIIAPADITVNVDPATCQAIIADLGTPITDDNCSVNTISNDAPATFPVGNTTVTWTVEDGSGNISTDTQTITVIDNIDPTIIDLPSDITVSNDPSLCSAVVSWTEPTADDNCPGAVISQTGGVANGGVFPVGSNTVEYTVTDASGNSVQGTFTVTVTDDEDPTITAAADTIIEANQFCSAINIVLDSPTTNDNCGVVSVTNDAPVIFDLDTTIVTWTVVDAAGNTAIDTQLVIVVDSLAPVVSSPLPVTAFVDDNCEILGDSISLGMPNASDNCAVDTIYNDLPDTLTTGTYTVTWFAEDVAGNIGTSTQMLTILDTIAPTPVLMDTVITLSTSGPIVLIGDDIDMGSTDNCGVDEVILEQEVYDCNDLGVNVIGVRVIDVNGNVTDTSIVVEVVESGIDLDFDQIDDACDDDVNTTVVVVPSGFTPNGDGINDLFVITALDNFDQVELFVYNRYGNLVYESQQYENDWDGTSSKNGMELPDGTYYYVIQLDGEAQRNGYVYINRTL